MKRDVAIQLMLNLMFARNVKQRMTTVKWTEYMRDWLKKYER